jgi:predicted nucleotidyltransferase component of viral defense system
LKKHTFSVENQWFSGGCEITTYYLEELLGTKLSALYQRSKGRDLFDLWKALSTQKLDIDKIISCYCKYIAFVTDNPPSQTEFLQNMELKITDDEFLGDINLLIRDGENYNPTLAWELVQKELIEKL